MRGEGSAVGNRLMGLLPCVLVLAAICGGAAQAQVSYTVNGALTLQSGTDPLGLSGTPVQFNGTLAAGSVPVATGSDSATYNFPDVSITVVIGVVDVPNVPVTFSLPAGGLPTVSFSTTISEFGVNVPVSASLALPANTFTSVSTPPAFAVANIVSATSSTFTYGKGSLLTTFSIAGTVSGVNVGPTLQANPSALSFGFLIGGPAPIAQAFELTAGANLPVAVATDGAPWISATASDATTPTVVTVSVNSAGLSAGVYTSQISIASATANNTPLIVPVQFVVANPPPPGVNSMYPPVNRGEFIQSAPQGFGDRQNGWAWSMAWFRDKLYVGSNRAFDCLQTQTIKVVFPIEPYPPNDQNIDCAPDYNDLPLQAEIWSWTPDMNKWAEVFQSPLTIPNPDSDKPTNTLLPPDVGFRGMQVYTEADGTQALYVSGVSSKSIHKFANPNTGVPAAPGARLLRTVDGVNFTPISSPTSLLVTGDYASFRGMAILNNCLYLIAGDLTGAGEIVGSCNPSDADSWYVVNSGSFFEIAVYNNFLYGAESGTKGFNLIKSDGSGFPNLQFTTVIPDGGYRKLWPNQSALSMKVFNGDLYVGGNGIHSFFGAEMYRAHADDTWDLIVGMPRQSPTGAYIAPLSGLTPGFGWDFNAHMWRMEVFDDRLYCGTFDLATTFRNVPLIGKVMQPELGFDLWWSGDGVNWAAADVNGFEDEFNFGVRSLLSTDWGFFLGSANFYYGLKVYQGVPAGFNFPPYVNPDNPTFTTTVGSTTPFSENLQVSSVNIPSTFTVTASVNNPIGGNWLQVNQGSVTPPVSPSSTPLSLTANPSGLPVGFYQGTITFSNPALNVQRQLPVTLNVLPPSGAVLSPSALTFTYQEGAITVLPAPQAIAVSASGQPFDYVAGATINTPTGGNWLQVSPSTGTAPLSPGTTGLQVSVNPTGLATGTYTAIVTVAGAMLGPQQVAVTLVVRAAGLNVGGLGIGPLKFDFTGGGSPPPVIALPISTNGLPVSFTVTTSSASTSNSSLTAKAAKSGWLSVASSTGVAPTAPQQTLVMVSANVSGLSPGHYSGTVTITAVAPAAGSASVSAFLSVNPAPAGTTATPPPALASSRTVANLQNGGGWRSSIVLVDTGAKAQPAALNFSGGDGKALSLPLLSAGPADTFSGTVQSGGSITAQTDGSGVSTQNGWAALSTDSTVGGSVILTSQVGAQPPSEVGLPLNSASSKTLWMPFDETNTGLQYTTILALTNAGTADSVAVLSFVDDGGQAIPITGTIDVPANGHYSGDLGAMFPPLAGKRGVVQISSTNGLAGVGYRFNGTAYTALPALSNVAQTSKTIPHLVNGSGWKSAIWLVNAGTQPAAFTLSFYASDGSALTLPMGADGSKASLSGAIAPGQLRVIQTDGSGSSVTQASATLTTSGAIGGTAIFIAPAGASEAASPLTTYPSLALYFPFDETPADLGLSTTIELANPGASAASVKLSFTDPNGTALSETASITIPSNGHYESVLSTAFPQLAGASGVVKVVSSMGLTGLAIRYNGQAFTSIPAIVPGVN